MINIFTKRVPTTFDIGDDNDLYHSVMDWCKTTLADGSWTYMGFGFDHVFQLYNDRDIVAFKLKFGL